jgi:hypothetical protein
MKTLDTFRVNRIETVFLERWSRGAHGPGDHTPDGGLVVLRDGSVAMCGPADSVRIARLSEGRVTGLVDPLSENPVLAAYATVIRDLRYDPTGVAALSSRLHEASSQMASDSLKDLARGSRPVLKHMITLHKHYRGDDPQLQSKEAKTAMQAILNAWDDTDVDAAHMFGRVSWDPDPITWMSFFDEVGSQPLGNFLDIEDTGGIPEVPGSEFETPPEEVPDEPEYSHDDVDPESEEFDASTMLQ